MAGGPCPGASRRAGRIDSFLGARMDDVLTKLITIAQLEHALLRHLKSKVSFKY